MTAKKKEGKLRVGTSGYQYNHWKGVFYPVDMPKKKWFKHYCKHFDTVEINNTFYNLPEKDTFSKWRTDAPSDFLYVLKFSRYGSHLKCLKDPESAIGMFMERSAALQEKLGPILVQLKPNWGLNIARLRTFLEAVPKDQRWAIEFRNPDWLCEEVFDVLREHSAALCVHDMIGDHPEIVTTGWTYLRFHGNHYQGSYSSRFLSARADKIAEYLSEGADVYAFFNNDAQGFAPRNALDLKRFVEQRL
ncbi:MAG: DUF72 domain-containing protein [Verrucomicrobiota bacterium]